MDMTEVTDLVRKNTMLKNRLAAITEEQNEIKAKLKEALEELGEETDNGNIVIEVDDEVSGISKVTHQRRVSKSLDIDVAEELLTERGIHERCITMVPMLNEDEIMAAYYNGDITEEDIDKMFPATVTWALIVK